MPLPSIHSGALRASWAVAALTFAAGNLFSSFAVAEEEIPAAAAAPVDFERDVRPILEKNCFGCHGPDKQRSSFRLDRRSAAIKGGDLGAAILPGRGAESPLVRFVAGAETGMEMPPEGEGERLTAEQVGLLRKWIDDGASWPDALAGEVSGDPSDWWSLKPITRPAVPELAETQKAWVRNPIDAFILDRLNREGLSHSAEANRRTLIRRLTFDLHGLPPAPEDVAAFLADESPDAYEKLVDRLLDSERYGERWARHWLDVAHYADSHGHDQDRPRPNAWPYRDWLIRSLNEDKPYSRFVAEQVAGDSLSPDDPASIAATGFLAAGPFDESSLVSINEDSIDRIIGQYLDRDDIVTTTMTTFTGLTVGCARCHDHKFDPITQRDYYALQAVFAGIDKADRRYDRDASMARRRAELRQTLTELDSGKGQPDPSLLTSERLAAVAAFDQQRANRGSVWTVLEPTEWKAKEGTILKALLDRSILAVGTAPERDTYVVTGSTAQTSVTSLRLEVLTDETLPNQGPGRAVNGNLHLTELRVKAWPPGHPEQSQPVAIRTILSDFDQAGWEVVKAIDNNPATAWGVDPQEGKPHEAVLVLAQPITFADGAVIEVELEQHHGRQHTIGRLRLSAAQNSDSSDLQPIPAELAEIAASSTRTDTQTTELSRWLWRRDVERQLAALPAEESVFCGTNQFVANGSFRPASQPRPVHVLTRGDVLKPGEPAVPGTIQAVLGPSSSFELSDPQNESARRAALARWLIDPQNPLTWRVIVNRVWHYHIGKGLVDTPSDFGRMGGVPSHPELLDWLAAEFRDGGGSLKDLHRLIVTSRVYRQAAAHNAEAALKDSDNRLLWRMNRRRLDAESVRDSILAVSGKLDLTMYGPPVMQFVIAPGIHITPEADYQSFDVDSPASFRRSIYRFILRTRPDPLLEVLDCPDASQAAPVRSDSVSALQALALWNDKFTLRQSEHLATRAVSSAAELSVQIRFVCERVLNRLPTDNESAAWTAYAQQHGLANLCRVLLNSSEFLFVE